MDQVYFVSRPNEDGRRPVLYRYGNFCYADTLRVDGCDDMRNLPRIMQHLQSVQGEMPFFAEYAAIPKSSTHHTSLQTLNDAIDYILDEVVGSGGALEDLAASGESWLDADGANVYFELEAQSDYSCNGADVIFAKTFRQDVLLTVIFYNNSFYATLTDASTEQALVDTLFPNIYGRQRGMNLRTFDHPKFAKLAVWEASDTFPDPSTIAEPEEVEEPAPTPSAASEDLSGDGYNQNYIVMRPQHLREGSYRRRVLFRFGNWCYEGEVDFGVDALHLGDVPEVLPALQKQQGSLAFMCETTSVPTASLFSPVLKSFCAGVEFFCEEMIAAQAELERLSELSETAWIDADWAASFFELQFHPSEALRQVEVIASKCYYRGGIILHTVLFGGSIYAVLADAGDDQPLLDVAFPDVTARCRGVQLQQYDHAKSAGMLMRPRRLLVWEGRRKGSAGVGWGTGSLVSEGIGADIRAAARARAEAAAERDAATASRPVGPAGGKEPEPDTEPAPAAGGKVEEPDEDVPASKAAEEDDGVDDAPDVPASKLSEDDPPARRPAAATGSGGGGARPDFGVRARHHLAPLGAGGGRLKSLPGVGGPAPWDTAGKPVLGKK